MRNSAILCLAWTTCSPVSPPAEAPESADPVAPGAPPATKPEAAQEPSPAPAAPVDPGKLVPHASLTRPPVVDVPGPAAQDLGLGQGELAAIDATCKDLCDYPPCKCDATRPLPHFLLLRLAAGEPSPMYSWFVLQKKPKGWVLLKDTENIPGGDEVATPDQVCAAPAKAGPLPADVGIIDVRLPDLNADGQPDLLFQCRSREGSHELNYCLSDKQYCKDFPLRTVVENDQVELDLDVEFKDGWFVRKVRTDVREMASGNVQVDWLRTPDPGPPR